MTTTLATDSRAHTATPVLPTDGAHLAFRPLPTGSARITGGFWALRQDRNGADAIRSGYHQLEAAGNFLLALGLIALVVGTLVIAYRQQRADTLETQPAGAAR